MPSTSRRRRRSRTASTSRWKAVGIGALIAVVAGVVAVGLVWVQPAPSPNAGTVPSSAFTPTPRPTPVQEPLKLPAAGSPVLIIGDSWSTGYGADDGLGYASLLYNRTSWAITNDAQPGTGYQSTMAAGAETFEQRAGHLPDISPALVILQGGLNDFKSDLRELPGTAGRTIQAIHARYPDAQVVLVGPGTFQVPPPDTLVQTDTALRDAARKNGAFYISPISENWETAENFGAFWNVESDHPSNEGHAIFEQRLWDDLNSVTRTVLQ